MTKTRVINKRLFSGDNIRTSSAYSLPKQITEVCSTHELFILIKIETKLGEKMRITIDITKIFCRKQMIH